MFPFPAQNFAKYPTCQGVQPANPAAASCLLMLTAAQQFVDVDLTADKRFDDFDPQGIFIDNSANAQAVTISFTATGQSLILSAQFQGYLPVILPSSAERASLLKFRVQSPVAANTQIGLQLLNTPTSPMVWLP